MGRAAAARVLVYFAGLGPVRRRRGGDSSRLPRLSATGSISIGRNWHARMLPIRKGTRRCRKT